MASVSVEAVREQLESMGRNVPEDLIETFLRDLGVEPVLSPSAERERREECTSRTVDDEDDDEDVCREKVEGFMRETREATGWRGASPRRQSRENESPETFSLEDKPLRSYRPASPGTGRFSLSPSGTRRCLSARSPSRLNLAHAQPPKTDRVAKFQQTQASWKSCSSVQLGRKSKPAQNFHKLFAAQHAAEAKKKKRAVQGGRRKATETRIHSSEYVIPGDKRRDNLRWEVRQSLRRPSN